MKSAVPWINTSHERLYWCGWTLTNCSPLSTFQLPNNRIVFIGIGGFDCIFTDRREVEVGNEPSWLLRVRAEEDIADANIPVIDPELTETMETL